MPLPPLSCRLHLNQHQRGYWTRGRQPCMGDSGPEWLHLVPVLSPPGVKCGFLPNNAYISTHDFPRGCCGWQGTEKEESQRKHRVCEPREKGAPLSAALKNSINNNSKCNNTQMPDTQVRLGEPVVSAQRDKGVISFCIFVWTLLMEKQTKKDSFPIHI